MYPSAPASQLTRDVNANALQLYTGSTTTLGEDLEWNRIVGSSGLTVLREGLYGLEQLRSFDDPFLPIPPPTGSELDLAADPPPLVRWTIFNGSPEETGAKPSAAPATPGRGASPTPPTISPFDAIAAILSNICLHDEDDLQRALQRRNLESFMSRETATVDPLLINSLAAVPSSVEIWDDSSSDSGTVRPTLSPIPASPAFSEVVARDSGYESDASSPSPRTTTREKIARERARRRPGPYPSGPSLAVSPSPRSSTSFPLPLSSPDITDITMPRLKTFKRRNISASASGMFSPSSPPAFLSPSVPPPSSSSSASMSSTPISRSTSSNYDFSLSRDSKTCPVCHITFPKMGRAEMTRHFKTHEHNKGEWVCAGVPLELATSVYKLEAKDIESYKAAGRTTWFAGRQMVGGCFFSFSRLDALKRHERQSKKCVWAAIREAAALNERTEAGRARGDVGAGSTSLQVVDRNSPR